MGLLLVSQARLIAGDPFLHIDEQERVNHPGLSGMMIARLKEHHGHENNAYDIGIFGSSIVFCWTQAYESRRMPILQFSVHGQSLRTGISLINSMAAQNKLPGISFFALDNFEVQSFGNPRHPDIIERLTGIFRDLMDGLRDPEMRLMDVARMMNRHLIVQRDVLERVLNFDLAMASFRALLAERPHQALLAESGPGYMDDGRYYLDPPKEIEGFPIFKSRPLAFIQQYFRHDLARLKKIERTSGSRIIVLEMPLSPKSSSYLLSNPGSAALQTRKIFVEACKNEGLHASPHRSDFPPISDRGGTMCIHHRKVSLNTFSISPQTSEGHAKHDL